MLMPNANIANFDAKQINTLVEVTHDDEYVQVFFHGVRGFNTYVRQLRQSRGGSTGFAAEMARTVRDASCILSALGFLDFIRDCGFVAVQ